MKTLFSGLIVCLFAETLWCYVMFVHRFINPFTPVDGGSRCTSTAQWYYGIVCR